MSKRKVTEKDILEILDEVTSDPESDWEESEDDPDPVPDIIAEESEIDEQPFTNSTNLIIPESDSDNEYFSSDDEDVPLCSLASNSWSKIHCGSIKCPDFNEYVGVKGRLKDEGKEMLPHDFFLVLFSDELIEHLLFQTNLYATQEGKEKKKSETGAIPKEGEAPKTAPSPLKKTQQARKAPIFKLGDSSEDSDEVIKSPSTTPEEEVIPINSRHPQDTS
ncbi:hypothetical protein C0J52_16847 [Blattella germanica]|nr:hypothetical protein C0J52_16847 [Blattella germanica]